MIHVNECIDIAVPLFYPHFFNTFPCFFDGLNVNDRERWFAILNSLPYYREICKNLIHADTLAIYGKGVGYEHIALHIGNAFADSSHFYVLLGFETEKNMADFYACIRHANRNAITHMIQSTTTVRERSAMYKKKGLFLCYSARPLLMDILHERLAPASIDGMCLLKAHTILLDENGIECYLLHQVRSSSNAKVCAMSDNPAAFLGPGKLTHAVKSIFYSRDVHFFPRFHLSLKKALDSRQPDVHEVRIPLGNCIRKIQTILFSILSELLRELSLNMEKIGFCEYTTPKIADILDGKLFKHLKKLFTGDKKISIAGSSGSKLKSVQKIFAAIEEMVDAVKRLYLLDPLSFAIFAERLALMSKNDGVNVSLWLHAKDAHLLIPASHEYRDDYVLRQTDTLCGSRKIATKEGYIRKLLTRAADQNKRALLVLRSWVFSDTGDVSFCNMNNVDSVWHAAVYQTFQIFHDCPALCGIVGEVPLTMGWNLPALKTACRKHSAEHDAQTNPTVDEMVQNLYRKSRNLDEAPDIMIICGVDLLSIRRAELMQGLMTTYSSKRMQIYLITYDGSVEQCVYLNEAKIEKNAFTELVSAKADLVFPENSELSALLDEVSATLSTHEASGPALRQAQPGSFFSHCERRITIIIDEREFRSSLPFFLAKIGGVQVVPRTLFCGDYVLADDVVVERKSAPDLESSLTDGRLFSQLYTMIRSYSVGMILIECGSSTAFEDELQLERAASAKRPVSKVSASKILMDSRIIEKLCMITRFFPQIRFLWSTSDEETVRLFLEIKKTRAEPAIPADMGTVMNKDPKKENQSAVGAKKGLNAFVPIHEGEALASILDQEVDFEMNEDTLEDNRSESFAPFTNQILLNIPGINHLNLSKLTKGFASLADIARASKEALLDVLESEPNANLVYEALHAEHS